jgi:3-hydroxyisobutyrate dehydrogenase-like beta-hydroxyacid dehydrogenase
MKKIGFIGLGNVGRPMSNNLLQAGFEVVGYDIVSDPDAIAPPGRVASSVHEVGEECDVIVQSLPSVDAIQSTVDELVAVARKNQVLIDISSYPVADKNREAARLADKGTTMLDCEISGLPFMVANRTAVIFQSGDKKTIDAHADVFNAMGKRCLYLGEFGGATRMKLLANAMVASHNVIGAEILNLAARLGIDLELAVEALSPSAAGSKTFSNKAPLMLSRDFEGGVGPFRHMFTYLDRFDAMARRVGASTPVIDAAKRLFDSANEQDRGDQDIAAAIEIIEEQSHPIVKERKS